MMDDRIARLSNSMMGGQAPMQPRPEPQPDLTSLQKYARSREGSVAVRGLVDNIIAHKKLTGQPIDVHRALVQGLIESMRRKSYG